MDDRIGAASASVLVRPLFSFSKYLTEIVDEKRRIFSLFSSLVRRGSPLSSRRLGENSPVLSRSLRSLSADKDTVVEASIRAGSSGEGYSEYEEETEEKGIKGANLDRIYLRSESNQAT